ncbi:hypothetical protein J6590_049070 [Homalodisca vitripennis]|nr:hypothetical protein J6590_049070 [Homalodisca vitripennis]
MSKAVISFGKPGKDIWLGPVICTSVAELAHAPVKLSEKIGSKLQKLQYNNTKLLALNEACSNDGNYTKRVAVSSGS